MNVVQTPGWPARSDIESFLAWEDAREGRHELDGARVIAMTGGSLAHQWLIANLTMLFRRGLDPGRHLVAPEMRMRLATTVRYPDISIVAAPLPLSTRTLNDAVVIIEVLSDDSTAQTDRNEKRAEYAVLPSLRRYVLLEQTRPTATVFCRTAVTQALEGETTLAAPDTLSMPELGLDLALTDIYAGL